jgi:hypothetical protein
MFGLSPQILILISSMAAAAAGGWKVTAWYYQADIEGMRADKARAAAEAIRHNRKIEVLGIELAGAVSERDAFRHQRRDVQFRTVRQEVIKYVKSPVHKCDLSTDWVRVHDAAAGGRVPENPDTSGAADDAPGRVTDDIALEVVADNYGRCAENRDKLLGLQEWASGLKNLK